MHALHSTLLPPSAIHHALYLPNFTPSTIYPLPRPHDDAPEIKVTGNLVVAGGQDIRVFEIREQSIPIADGDVKPDEAVDSVGDEMEQDFFDNGPAEVRVDNHPRCIPVSIC